MHPAKNSLLNQKPIPTFVKTPLTMPKAFLARLQTIDELIQKKNTGNAAGLANKLNISQRTVKEYIAVMKELGAPIYYNRKINSYCYHQKGSFILRFEATQ
jgi:predicted DNA-binding transcriptional regulator YafY